MKIERLTGAGARCGCPIVAFLTVLFAAATGIGETTEWRGFRGPDASGIGLATQLPTTWSDDENVVWKIDLPGAGGSCPVVVHDRVYVTCYAGYAQSIETPGDLGDLTRWLVCVDQSTGEKLWAKEFPHGSPNQNTCPATIHDMDMPPALQ